MSNNPLFPQDDTTPPESAGASSAAVELIRSKVARAFADEPDAKAELAEVQHEKSPSKHQQYMQQLSASGQSLAEIQTAWHHYYTMLSDVEKHEVWQEFYAANQHTPYQKLFQKNALAAQQATSVRPAPEQISQPQPASLPTVTVAQAEHILPVQELPAKNSKPKRPPRTKVGKALDKPAVREMKHKIANKVSANGRLKAKHHLQSLMFGLASGALVLAILLFSFFNQVIIAPFIQPSRTVSATPIIMGTSGTNIDASKPQIIIPKINVQIPLDFTVQSNSEQEIQTALDEGVVHYPSTVNPGQNGNAAFFGHSSNNIFNPGKYKFAFVLLRTLTTGDTFYITFEGKVYVYQVIAKEVVHPTQVSVLADTKGKTATAALITCDPPGSSANRLVVWGEQISPNISTNTTAAAGATTASAAPAQITDSGPTLWNRFVNTVKFWD